MESSSRAPLSNVWQVCAKDGPSLPFAGKLRRLPQSQAVLPVLFLPNSGTYSLVFDCLRAVLRRRYNHSNVRPEQHFVLDLLVLAVKLKVKLVLQRISGCGNP